LDVDVSNQNSEINMTRFMRLSFVVVVVVAAWPSLRAAPVVSPSGSQAIAVATPPQETWEQFQGPAAEQFLLKAQLRGLKNLGTGVTLPQRAELELNGVTHSAVFKTIDDRKGGVTQLQRSSEINFQDSWQLEVAGYALDRMIGLRMVPATVERTLNGRTGSLQWLVQSAMSEAERRTQNATPPDLEAWHRTYQKMELFDQLIFNVDRHLNNVLVTEDFDLRLIDHSRSFRAWNELRNPERVTRFSRSLLDGLRTLEFGDLRKRVGRYLVDDQIRGLLARRDAILALAASQVAERGEAAVLYP
jgi:hypothetical protein